ncbi:Hpr(Ser) kinase/phosphatase [Cognatiyoonia sediminum]|uniref:Hpr(Ser) kinase/phosphatase n=1 Tax=Cognatiyoonia sediminum TaxID=1508389 RepID=A0A1M5RLE0_9RHOB|nr:HPr kinase/phosphatase C-terminal domain-containing protein [Cognatiyoonia sediminum]SHH26999.1 Hpr(Ser) kinase/phosphatase [Cognatiyoonia sediminum]
MEQIVHASCVSVDGKGLLIIGASGSGKSALALQLVTFGADLIADDRTNLTNTEEGVVASSPPAIRGSIEARGMGILQAPTADSAVLRYVVKMDEVENQRLPDEKNLTLMGHTYPLFYRVEGIHFAASLWLLMRHGRSTL